MGGNGTGYLEAGLPNITGNTGYIAGYPSGAFYSGVSYHTGGLQGDLNSGVAFDASRSSSIYGNSTTVQPATCKTYFIIKY